MSNGKMLISVLQEVKGLELAAQTRFHCADCGKAQMQLQENSKLGKAHLGNLFRHQQSSPWQAAGKEAAASTHAISSCLNGAYTAEYQGLITKVVP